jgi:hypothetical protein
MSLGNSKAFHHVEDNIFNPREYINKSFDTGHLMNNNNLGGGGISTAGASIQNENFSQFNQ